MIGPGFAAAVFARDLAIIASVCIAIGFVFGFGGMWLLSLFGF